MALSRTGPSRTACDSSSVDPDKDIVAADPITDDEFFNAEEIYQDYYRPHHRWYYLSGQNTNEIAVFRQ